MKKILSTVAIATLVMFMSCTKDKEDELEVIGKNIVSIEFDNGFDGDKLMLGNEYVSNGQKITPTALDYIVGNFVLTNDKGEEVAQKGYFYIISEGNPPKKDRDGNIVKENGSIVLEGDSKKVKILKIDLKDIPAGNYTKIKFGIGVDKETYDKQTAKSKESGKSTRDIDFWVACEDYNLTWDWTSGYKNLAFEGDYITSDKAEEKGYRIHIANQKLYGEVELDLKNLVVAEKNSPQIHINVEAINILGGKSKITLPEEGGDIMGGPRALLIRDNYIDGMFSVDHIHNSGTHH